MAHGQWTEFEAPGLLEAWRRSGLPLERYAKQRGLVPQRLRAWRKKLAEREVRSALAPTPAILPVHVSAESPRRGEPVTVLLRTGHMLRIPNPDLFVLAGATPY
jgi:hypothetical protein